MGLFAFKKRKYNKKNNQVFGLFNSWDSMCIYFFAFYCFIIFGFTLASPIEIMLFFLVLALFFLMVNLFFSIRFSSKKKCQEFRNKYQEMKDFIQSYRDAAQNIQQDDVKSNAETDISEHDRQENNQLENSGWIPALNNDEFIIVVNNDKDDSI